MRTIFEDDNWLIELNDDNELFLTPKVIVEKRPRMRVTPQIFGMVLSCDAGFFTPWSHKDLPAIKVMRSRG